MSDGSKSPTRRSVNFAVDAKDPQPSRVPPPAKPPERRRSSLGISEAKSVIGNITGTMGATKAGWLAAAAA